jgi:hypothetical protein
MLLVQHRLPFFSMLRRSSVQNKCNSNRTIKTIKVLSVDEHSTSKVRPVSLGPPILISTPMKLQAVHLLSTTFFKIFEIFKFADTSGLQNKIHVMYQYVSRELKSFFSILPFATPFLKIFFMFYNANSILLQNFMHSFTELGLRRFTALATIIGSILSCFLLFPELRLESKLQVILLPPHVQFS